MALLKFFVKVETPRLCFSQFKIITEILNRCISTVKIAIDDQAAQYLRKFTESFADFDLFL